MLFMGMWSMSMSELITSDLGCCVQVFEWTVKYGVVYGIAY